MKLEQLEELEEKATPSPWDWHAYEREPKEMWPSIDGPDGYEIITRDSGVYGPKVPDGDLIVEMRNALPGLLKIARAASWFKCVEVRDDDCSYEGEGIRKLQQALKEFEGE